MRRREFLMSAAALAAARRMSAQAAPRLLYVASYSSPQGPEGSKGNGEGIYLFAMDPATGALKQRAVFRNQDNPSWIAFNKSHTRLYSANEISDYQGKESGSVSAYAVDHATGRLTWINTQSSQGAGPCYISLDHSDKYVLAANYHGGTIAALPIAPDGSLRAATDVRRDQGTPGSQPAASAPPGSFAISGHDKPHAHMILSDPTGRFVLSTDLGLDTIFVWWLDAEKGTLMPAANHSVKLPAGDGPRHFAFHPNGRRLYCLQEEASTLTVFDYDPETAKMAVRQTLSTLPKGFGGTNFTSEIAISPDGRFLYAANRLHDSIAWFPIDAAGALTLGGEEWTRGDYPRSFTIDPTGGFLYSCNQRADAVACFRIDRRSGALAFTGQYTPVGTPAMVLFL
ncbi:MAG: lactonase family protein [Acidobacteriota bacterium]|nr:lactonase family protein [Acidobacteriota bacterium]